MTDQNKTIGKITLVVLLSVIIGYWISFSVSPSLQEQAQARITEINKRMDILHSQAEGYRQLINSVQAEYNLLEQEKEPLVEILTKKKDKKK